MPYPLARDTSLAAEAHQIALLQQRHPAERLAMTCAWTAFAVASSRAALRRARPDLDALALAQWMLALTRGPTLAARLPQPPIVDGAVAIGAAVEPLTRALHTLGIPYYVSGSLASSAFSFPRTIADIDVAAALQGAHGNALLTALAADYVVDHAELYMAIHHRDQEPAVALLHPATSMVIDLVVTADRPVDASRYQRVHHYPLPGATGPIRVAAPEDILLTKLMWLGQDEVEAGTQWRDAVSRIRVQDQALDLSYLRHWALVLGVADRLDAALHH